MTDLPVDRWSKLISDNPKVQKSFRKHHGMEDEESTSSDDNGIPLSTREQLSDRLQKIQDKSPQFVSDLAWFLEPLGQMEKEEEERQRVEERKKRPLTGHNREEIKKTCQRYGLGKSWNDLLIMLNQLNAAGAGKLYQKPSS